MRKTAFAALLAASLSIGLHGQQTWMADNGNGTFTNPLFYEEFSDPDIIRFGSDYYMVDELDDLSYRQIFGAVREGFRRAAPGM